VKTERLDFLAANPFCTGRFAWYVGRRCRQSSIRAVARELERDWHTVKALECDDMQARLDRAGKPAPKVIGADEIPIRRGHSYRIVVSDLERKRPIWFGGADRSEASMAQFYTALGPRKCRAIRMAVMDMWQRFRAAARTHVPQAAILFDKFHILRHPGEALDAARRSEYRRLSGKDRSYIKGQKYALLSDAENPSLDGRAALVRLLKANKRLNTACLLRERFSQPCDCRREAWARRFFEQWRESLKWQRLALRTLRRHDRPPPGRHIAAYCHSENRVSLGFFEGLNNKIRVIQRRAYGLRDEHFLRLKVLTCMLPAL
jgi:transposase